MKHHDKRKPKLTRGNKHFIRELNALWDFAWRNRVSPSAPGWKDGPDGKMPPADPRSSGGTYTPPLSPVFTSDPTSPTMGITSGWINGPFLTTAGDNEIVQHQLWPFMPRIGSTRLDAETPATLSMFTTDTNYIYAKIDLTAQDSIIGGHINSAETGVAVLMSTGTDGITTTQAGSVLGLTTGNRQDTSGGDSDFSDHNHDYSVPPHSHPITAASHTHGAIVRISNVVYTMNTSPTFLLNTTGFPDDTETIKYIPWGKYVLNSAGEATSDEWYRRDHFDYYAPHYVVGGETSTDRPENPRVLT